MNKLGVIVVLFMLSTFAFAIERAYEEGKADGQKGIATDGMEQQVKEFSRTESEAAGLSTDNDTVLAERGSAAFKGEFGELLNASAAQIIDAREEHQINKQNTFYQASLLLEQNPFKQTGGQRAQHKANVQQETIEHCEEGISFDIDLINQLTYSPPPRQEMNTELIIYYPDYIKNVGRRNDEMGPMSVNTRNHQINIQRFREHACPHFKPIDAVTGQTYKINCNRISNFYLVGVVDGNRVSIVDKYGDSCQPVKLLKLSYKHDTYQSEEGGKDFWSILNPADEELVEKHSCYETRRQCLDAGEKHFDELVVNRPCWKEQITYRCTSEPQDGCKHLKDKNCTLQSISRCQVYADASEKLCVKWQHTYKCLIKEETMSPGIKGGELFCMDGGCFTPELEKNTDLNEAVSKLAVMREMATKENFMAGEPPKVFPGISMGCNKSLANFKNCCQTKGWGLDIGLASCSEQAKQLAIKRNNGLCHYVGTYCAERLPVTGICVRKKSVYCCFQSKLSRIFHQQGRPQLGKGWGSAQGPDCNPFTVEELTKLDFSKMDLSEIFADLFNRVNEAAAKKMPQQMMDQMPVMQSKIDEIRDQRNKNWDQSEYDDEHTTRTSF